MIGLLKLVAYGLLGYAIYEFVRGITDAGGGSGPGVRGQHLRYESKRGGGSSVTGRGEGQTVSTQDADGGSVSHRVGRGVVTR